MIFILTRNRLLEDSGSSRSQYLAKCFKRLAVALIVPSAFPRFLSLNSVLTILPFTEGRSPGCWGRGRAWSKIRAWGVRGPGFKSQRPHYHDLGPPETMLTL